VAPNLDNAPRPTPTDTTVGKAWIEAGVLWHRIDGALPITEQLARTTVAELSRFVGDREMPAVVDIRGVQFADREARDVFANEVHFETATAIIVESAMSKGLGNIYLKVSRPKRPTRLFTSVHEAREWAFEHTLSG
jgi:hypothetical protein